MPRESTQLNRFIKKLENIKMEDQKDNFTYKQFFAWLTIIVIIFGIALTILIKI